MGWEAGLQGGRTERMRGAGRREGCPGGGRRAPGPGLRSTQTEAWGFAPPLAHGLSDAGQDTNVFLCFNFFLFFLNLYNCALIFFKKLIN